MAKKCEAKAMLLVGTKVKAAVRAQNMLCSGELLEALNCRVYCMISKAVERAKANKRSTVKPQDV
jgi:histone H3/H4